MLTLFSKKYINFGFNVKYRENCTLKKYLIIRTFSLILLVGLNTT